MSLQVRRGQDHDHVQRGEEGAIPSRIHVYGYPISKEIFRFNDAWGA